MNDVFGRAEQTPDAQAVPAYRDEDELVSLSYRELVCWVERFACALAELGDTRIGELPRKPHGQGSEDSAAHLARQSALR
ncbi:hypothetical protein [Pseudonocardia spinosispora]|uniref:hypothetical protein n=1 Tax=Pseudonocardia spinosispora TaxID=103441 RepID=UPI0003FB41E7|nr:hypothetical protein [Pseudonocardia spinosispora]